MFGNGKTTVSAKTAQTLVVKNLFEADLVTEFRSSYAVANSVYGSLFYLDFGLSRRFWNGKGRLRLSGSDLFNTAREKETTDFNNTHIDFYQKRQTRAFGIFFNYHFNWGKAFKSRKVEQGSADERNRIGN
jgi:hypothetical protein